MERKILIKNFDPVKMASINLNNNFQVFIGEQASGKSTISKIVYFCLVPSAKYGLNQPDGYVPVFFIYRQQIVCHTDHAPGSDLDLQRL